MHSTRLLGWRRNSAQLAISLQRWHTVTECTGSSCKAKAWVAFVPQGAFNHMHAGMHKVRFKVLYEACTVPVSAGVLSGIPTC